MKKNYSSNPCVPLPENAKDVWEIALSKGISLSAAVKFLEELSFIGYNDYGQEIYVEKEKEDD